MKQFVKMRIVLLMVTGFSVGMGSAVAMADGKGQVKAYSLEIVHEVKGIDEDGEMREYQYTSQSKNVTWPQLVPTLPELEKFSFRANLVPKYKPENNFICRYDGTEFPAKVHLSFIDENGKRLPGRDSKAPLTLGGRLHFTAPNGYALINNKDAERVAIQQEESWIVSVKSMGLSENAGPQKNPENTGNSGTTVATDDKNSEMTQQVKPDVSLPKPEVPSVKPEVPTEPQTSAPKPLTPTMPQLKPQSNTGQRPQIVKPISPEPTPTNLHVTTTPTKTKQSVSPKQPQVMTTSALPQLNHQNPLDWWQPVTGTATNTAHSETAMPKKKRPSQATNPTKSSKPARIPATKTEQEPAQTHHQASLRVVAPKSPDKRLPQTSEQTTPMAVLGGIALSSTASTIIYQFRRRKN